MGDKATGFVNKELDILFDKLGIVSREFFTKDNHLHIYLAFNKPYAELEDLIELQKELKSEHVRVYTKAYSMFETVPHTGVIFCQNVTNNSLK